MRYETLFDKVHSFVLFAPDHQQYVPGLAYCRFHRRGPDTPKLVYTTPPVDLDGDGLDDLVQVQKTLEGYRLIINTGNGVSHVLRDFIPSTEPPVLAIWKRPQVAHDPADCAYPYDPACAYFTRPENAGKSVVVQSRIIQSPLIGKTYWLYAHDGKGFRRSTFTPPARPWQKPLN